MGPLWTLISFDAGGVCQQECEPYIWCYRGSKW